MNPKRKRQIKRKANRQANRAFERQIQSQRQDVKRLKRQKRREQADTSRAADYLQNALGDLEVKGLKGRFAEQFNDAIGGMIEDVPQMERMMKIDTRRAYRPEIQNARSAVADSRLQRTLEAKDLYRSRIADVQEAEAKEQQAVAQRHRARQKEVGLIEFEIDNLIDRYGRPKNKEDWAKLADKVAEAEGISDPFLVAKLVDQMRAGAYYPLTQVPGQTAAAVASGVSSAFRR